MERVRSKRTSHPLYLAYFIGRCNPPHQGHIDILVKMLKDVMEHGHAKALILLGSGPGKARTSDNPISFELKQEFIVYKLTETLRMSPGDLNSICQILEMSNSFIDVPAFVRRQVSKTYSSVEIVHYAGDKEGDGTKLARLGERSVSVAKPFSPDVRFSTTTMIVKQGDIIMSATEIRRDAYQLHRDAWIEKYASFYGPFTHRMYDEITESKGKRGTRKMRKRKTFKINKRRKTNKLI